MLALQLLCEGNSIRSASRITGLHRDTIGRLLLDVGGRCESMMASRITNLAVRDVQIDEAWQFVGCKERNRPVDAEGIGDAWCFIGIERNTKLILAFEVGRRTVEVAMQFITKLAKATNPEHRFQLTSDGCNVYPYSVGMILGDRVDYAQLVKIYTQAEPEAQRRYSPPDCVEAIPAPVYGDPQMERICTSHIERQNGSLRQWCKRMTRLTYAFSKSWVHHRAAMALHFAYYNFCRVHRSIKMTPAMAAGLTGRALNLRELLA